MLKELQIIGLIHSGDLTLDDRAADLIEPHLSPHMLKDCKLDLTKNDFCPDPFIHRPATAEAFSDDGGHTGLNAPLIWTLGESHINGVSTVCARLDQRLYSFHSLNL